MNVVVTMAGRGQRFKEAGYRVPKYQVQVNGRSLLGWSLESLRGFFTSECRLVFVALREDRARRFIRDECAAMGVSAFELVELSDMTDGQATTALHAMPALSGSELGLLIWNIDTYVAPEYLSPSDVRGSGWIPYFKALGTHWSFLQMVEGERVVRVEEKRRISPYATAGLYWFRSVEVYRHSYDKYYGGAAGAVEGERYVAPIYNQLISEGFDVYGHWLPDGAVRPMGTPSEVAAAVKAEAPRKEPP